MKKQEGRCERLHLPSSDPTLGRWAGLVFACCMLAAGVARVSNRCARCASAPTAPTTLERCPILEEWVMHFATVHALRAATVCRKTVTYSSSWAQSDDVDPPGLDGAQGLRAALDSRRPRE